MSHIVTRKSAVAEEKDKRTDSPMKDMKKKMAANAEKEKLAVEKTAEKQPEKTEKAKQSDKPADKSDKPKQAEKPAEKNEKPKQAEKPAEKNEKPKQADKPAEKNEKQKQPEKSAEKPAEKSADKATDKRVEKNGVDNKKQETKEKKDAQEKKDDKAEKNAKTDKKNAAKQNGSKHNGEANGEEASDDDVIEIADDEFPELAYDDTSENESPTPDSAPGRSITRRSQVASARTPETPQPADKPPQDPLAKHDPKDSKVLKLSETPPSDRKLRSDDDKKEQEKEEKKEDGKKEESGEKDEVIGTDADEERRKLDTNYSKSRVKVSPYRRSSRLADQTASSVAANYTGAREQTDGHSEDEPSASSQERQVKIILTPLAKVPPYLRSTLDETTTSNMADYSGNNTTMEMDITETSSFVEEEQSLNDSSYLNGLRSIRGRRSYKPLKELSLKHVNRSVRSANTSVSECRPTGTVVGRKRKPDAGEREGAGAGEGEGEMDVDIAVEAGEGSAGGEFSTAVHTKRMRLLDRIAQPFRRTLVSTPLPHRRNPEIVGINTDLPLTAPVASPPSPFDPEALKPSANPLTTTINTPDDIDKKRCVVM